MAADTDRIIAAITKSSEDIHTRLDDHEMRIRAMATEAWQDFRFYGVGQTQSQFDALLDVMNAAGAGISSNPNDYILTAAGHAPEIAFADSPSWLMQWSNNFFVRGE